MLRPAGLWHGSVVPCDRNGPPKERFDVGQTGSKYGVDIRNPRSSFRRPVIKSEFTSIVQRASHDLCDEGSCRLLWGQARFQPCNQFACGLPGGVLNRLRAGGSPAADRAVQACTGELHLCGRLSYRSCFVSLPTKAISKDAGAPSSSSLPVGHLSCTRQRESARFLY